MQFVKACTSLNSTDGKTPILIWFFPSFLYASVSTIELARNIADMSSPLIESIKSIVVTTVDLNSFLFTNGLANPLFSAQV